MGNKKNMFLPYCPQEKPHKKCNEKFAVQTEMQDYQSISIEQKGKCTETY